MEKEWRRLNGQRIELPLKQAVERTIVEEHALGNKLKVCIGTDSQVRGEIIHFASVIVFLRERKGGFMFIHQWEEKKNNEHPRTDDYGSRKIGRCRLHVMRPFGQVRRGFRSSRGHQHRPLFSVKCRFARSNGLHFGDGFCV